MLTTLKAIAIILLLSSSIIIKAQSGKPLFMPEIKYDNATFSGKITGLIPVDSVFNPINLSFNNVVTADRMSYDVPVKKDGTFSLSIPVQCISFAVAQSDYYENIICLVPGEETRLEISFDSDQKKHVKLINSLGLSADDAVNMMEVINSALDDTTATTKKMAPEMITPEIYGQQVISRLTKCLKLIENTDKLSGAAKQIAKSETKAWFISSFMFDYDKWLRLDYINYYKTSSVPKDFQPQIPGRSYYSFLKSLNLEDPANFSASFYSNVLQLILSNDTLDIPAIGDTPVDDWLVKVKEILKDDIGIGTAQFYDLLAGNAFAKQFNEVKPLNEIQKKNIIAYFTNKSFANVLFDENEKVKKIADKSRDANIYRLNESIENIMDTIIFKYKGKVIFVDFWTTWCAPCLRAMKESESVKKEFENKDVVFVYITNPTSPLKTWENKILAIQGEQYYITIAQWNFLQKIYKINGIPHYLIFNKTGELKYNQGGFMGNDNMSNLIVKLL